MTSQVARCLPWHSACNPHPLGGTTTPLPQLVGIEELAAHLGVSVRHLRRLVSERRIPFHKWGRLLRFNISEVVAWLDTVYTGPDDELRR